MGSMGDLLVLYIMYKVQREKTSGKYGEEYLFRGNRESKNI